MYEVIMKNTSVNDIINGLVAISEDNTIKLSDIDKFLDKYDLDEKAINIINEALMDENIAIIEDTDIFSDESAKNSNSVKNPDELPTDCFKLYLRDIGQYPVLEPPEEREIIAKAKALGLGDHCLVIDQDTSNGKMIDDVRTGVFNISK